MEWNKKDLPAMVDYINQQLQNRPMVDIETKDFEVNERVIHKKLIRAGYTRNGNEYILKTDTPAEPLEEVTEAKAVDNIKTPKKPTKEPKKAIKQDIINSNDVDISKLKSLLDNYDKIMELLENKKLEQLPSLRGEENKLMTIRLNVGLYNLIKAKALEENETATSLINNAIEIYLKRN